MRMQQQAMEKKISRIKFWGFAAITFCLGNVVGQVLQISVTLN